jgi:hypothetical protein
LQQTASMPLEQLSQLPPQPSSLPQSLQPSGVQPQAPLLASQYSPA